MTTATLPIELSERDLIPVRELIEDVHTQERATQLLSATITWLAAFTSFKRVRRRYGFPRGAEASRAYGAILHDLVASGDVLLACLQRGMFTLEQAPIDERNLRACVDEMRDDKAILDSGLLTADLSHLAAVFGELPAEATQAGA